MQKTLPRAASRKAAGRPVPPLPRALLGLREKRDRLALKLRLTNALERAATSGLWVVLVACGLYEWPTEGAEGLRVAARLAALTFVLLCLCAFAGDARKRLEVRLEVIREGVESWEGIL